MRTISRPSTSRPNLFEQAFISILIGSAIFAAAVTAFIAGYQMRYAGLSIPV
jgi:hypothetical protein